MATWPLGTETKCRGTRLITSRMVWGAVIMEEVALNQALKDRDRAGGTGVPDRRRA